MGGWRGALYEDDAIPLPVKTADPTAVDDAGWLYGKMVDGIGECFFLDTDGNPHQFTTGGVIMAGALDRDVAQKAVDTALSAAEVKFGLIEVTAAGKTMTLPAPSAAVERADVIIAPLGAFSTTVAIAGGSSFGGGGATSSVIPKGTAGHFVCDGTTWYFGGGEGTETLSILDLTDVSAKTGVGTTVVFNDTPTLLTPTIASFVNAIHSHLNAAGGGTLDASAIASGTFAAARIAEVIALSDLTDVTAKTGSGTTVVMSAAPTITGTPVFSGYTIASVFFAGTGGALTEDNTNLSWDATNKRLRVGPYELSASGDPVLGVYAAANPNIGIRETTNNVEIKIVSLFNGGRIGTTTNHPFWIQTNNNTQWEFQTAGHFIPFQPSTLDIGAAGNLTRSVYVGTSVKMPGQAGDISSPEDGDLWFNTTLHRYRGKENSTTFSFAAETIYNAALYSGANYGVKVQAAIDAAASAGGGVVDARGLIGAQSTTVTITFPQPNLAVQLWMGYCTLTAAAGLEKVFDFPQGVPTGSQGSAIMGAGPYNTTIIPAAGKTGIQVQDWSVTLQDFDVQFTSSNAANVGIIYHCGPLGAPVTGTEASEIIRNVTITGMGHTGIGLQLDNCQISSFYDVYVAGGFEYGVYLNEYSNNADHFYNLRVEDCTYSVVSSRHDDVFFHGGTLQANPTGANYLLWLNGNGPGGTGTFWFENMHFECQFAGVGAYAVQIENGPIYAYFSHCFFNGQDAGGDLHNAGNSCTVILDHCRPTKGVTNSGTALLQQIGPDFKGSPNDTGGKRTYWGDTFITCGYGTGDITGTLDFSFLNWKTFLLGDFGGAGADDNYRATIRPKGGGGQGALLLGSAAHGLMVQGGGFLIEATDETDTYDYFYVNATNGRTFIGQAPLDAVTPAGFYVANGAHTNITAGAEVSTVTVDLGVTMQWATGALADQRFFFITQPTMTFVGDSHVTDRAATFAIQGAPVAGAHAIFDKTAAALWVIGGLTLLDGALTVAGATEIDNTLLVKKTSGTPFEVQDGSSNSLFYVNETNANVVVSQQAKSSGASHSALSVFVGAHTGITASTEMTSVVYDLSSTLTWETGAIATQRDFYISNHTYAFAAASVVSDAATVYIAGAPIAGSNATITRSMALWIDDGSSRLDGQVGINVFPTHWLHIKATTPDLYVESTSTTSFAEIALQNNAAVLIDWYLFGGSATSSSYGITRANLGIMEYTGTKAYVIATATTAPLVFASNGTERIRLLSGDAHPVWVEATTDPGASDLTSGSNAEDRMAIYMKSDKLVIAYNRSGTVTYLTIPLDGATVLWTQSTSAP